MTETTDPPKGSMVGGLIAGLVFAAPFAILLSFVGLLVFYLGLFFFMLFGLLIGALMYRMWAPLRPLSRQRMLAGTALVTLCAWGSALYLEGVWIPINVSKAAMGQIKSLPAGMDDGQAKAIFQEDARRFLREHFPPGGKIGYFRWMLSSEPMAISLGEGQKTIEYKQRQSWFGFPIRVGLSLVLLFLGISLQVLPLQRSHDEAMEDGEEKEEEETESNQPIAPETT